MNREQLQDDLIDLGPASVETKGIGMAFLDVEGTLRYADSLSDD